jgi:acyl-CoA reductase-like NAD-dependent aldehyde dehydrogenase
MAENTTTYAVIHPATGEVIKKYPTATDAEVGQAFSRRFEGTRAVVEVVELVRTRSTHPCGRTAAR